jgi:hypothetical protein
VADVVAAPGEAVTAVVATVVTGLEGSTAVVEAVVAAPDAAVVGAAVVSTTVVGTKVVGTTVVGTAVAGATVVVVAAVVGTVAYVVGTVAYVVGTVAYVVGTVAYVVGTGAAVVGGAHWYTAPLAVQVAGPVPPPPWEIKSSTSRPGESMYWTGGINAGSGKGKALYGVSLKA